MKAKDIQRKRTNSGANGTREFIPYEDLVFLDVKDDLTPEVLGPEFKPQEMQPTRGKKEWDPDEQFNLLYLYFRDIGKEPLLTPEEEVEVCASMRSYEAETRRIETLINKLLKEGADRANKEELSRRIKRCSALMSTYSGRANELKERFVKANLRLVISIAKRYIGRRLSLLDLIQEGNKGLIRAVERFDHTMGYRFSSYASWWIYQLVVRALAEQDRTIRIPVYRLEQLSKVYRVIRMLKEEGREVTAEEISRRSGISVEVVKRVLEVRDVVYLDSPILYNEDEEWEGLTLLELIPDKESPTPESAVTELTLAEKIEEALSVLTPREGEIVRLRFGIGCESEHTLDEVGEKFGLSPERIRQIEKKALKKLLTSDMRNALESFLR